MSKKIKITRFAVLKGFEGVLLGRDIGGLLKPGHVYEIQEILDTLTITDKGEHALMQKHSGHTISSIAISGIHCLTKGEYENQS